MLISLLIGLAIGFYARTIYDKLNLLLEALKDRLESPTGVSRPTPRKVSEHYDNPAPTGPSRPLDPKQYAVLNQIEENKRRI